jgi:dephospho-CoA kinase
MSIFVAIVGLTGSGKSVVADYLKHKQGFEFVRFGQITLDLVKERWGEATEERERQIREEIRKKHGMAAFAILNMPKFEAALAKGNLVGDDLMSFEEYTFLKERFGDRLVLLSVTAGRDFRYKRISGRDRKDDKEMRWRSSTPEAAYARDLAQLANLNEGPSIAMADYFIVNQGTIKELEGHIEEFTTWLEKEKGLKK